MRKIRILLFFFISLLLIPFSVKADKVINLHLFYGDGCPHCAQEEEFLDDYLKEEKDINLIKYEVWDNKDNQELLAKVQDELNERSSGVPYLVIGDKVIVGYIGGITDENIKSTVKSMKKSDSYEDYVTKIINNEEIKPKAEKKEVPELKETDEKVTVPILGKVNPKKVSLPILSVVLGLVDGFNPCAMWILIFLITMLINSKDRKRMWILGLTFILTSGLVYLAFMLTWLNLATFISKIVYVRMAVALVALSVGFINLNKFYQSTKKDDGCDVVDKKDRKKIMNQIMKITKEKSFLIAIAGIILLAASVNIIEMMCSIGLPLLFTQILAMNNLGFGSYMLYMLIYIIFFLIDDIIIFAIAMTTFKVTGISTKYNKYSHLVAGILMILIGLLLFIKPSILMFNF